VIAEFVVNNKKRKISKDNVIDRKNENSIKKSIERDEVASR